MKDPIRQNTKLFSFANTKQSIEKEIKVFGEKSFYIKINSNKKIDYVNPQFTETIGFEEYELIDESLASLFHPDMPKVIFSVLQERLEKGKSMQIIQKYSAKNGQFLWLSSIYSVKLNARGVVGGYTCKSTPVYSGVVEKMTELYRILSKIESKSNNTELAKKYFIGFLEAQKTTYDIFIKSICDNSKIDVARTHETRDYILEEIEAEKRLEKNIQSEEVSYPKNKKAHTIEHDFNIDRDVFQRRA